jgi:hypothetical protein
MLVVDMKFIGTFIAVILCSQLFSQATVDDIDFDLIQHQQIKNYINDQKADHVENIRDFTPSCSNLSDFSSYQHQEKDYIIKESLPIVWANYTQTNPAISWDGKLVSFGLLISKQTNNIFYPGDEVPGIDTGQIIFLNLKLLGGIYHLAMAFEIINEDPENGIVEFSYLEGNKTLGIQRLQFTPTGEGYTKIVHSSYYKSPSKLRDKILYPYFHKRLINEFHRNFRRRLRQHS